MRKIALFVFIAVSGVPTAAQSQETRSPYVGMEGRTIKSLSAREIDALLAGEGMALALAAELNGYPGPKHVLDLSDSLMLTPDQVERVRMVFERMAGRAKEIGADIVRLERLLDDVFAGRHASPDSLVTLTSAIAEQTGALRATHLVAHLELDGLLTEHQVMTYQRLRGYGTGDHVHRGVPD